MIWIKHLSGGSYSWNWVVGHKGLNSGTNPWNYYLTLNTTGAEAATANRFNDTAPTSANFTLGDVGNVNENNSKYVAMLFASANDADGNPISKVGYYTGDGGSGDTGQVITTGFQPRFLIIKRADGSANWYVFDTLRGWTTFANNQRIKLNTNAAQDSTAIYVLPQSTGFKVNHNTSEWNANGFQYIYYAHD